MVTQLAQIDDGTSGPFGRGFRAGDRESNGDVFTGDKPGPSDVEEQVGRPMPRSPRYTRRRGIDVCVLASCGVDDVGEEGTVVLSYLDADGASAMVRKRIE
ncbi:hypothetical protein [Microbacterium oxydans]|uniref:hypothetical protein n=1 Tax=Microbacterium oxydans TaxID=82380 RepID=UPI0012E095DE|nr:hypothetical protein [Microbacterium oxydans]